MADPDPESLSQLRDRVLVAQQARDWDAVESACRQFLEVEPAAGAIWHIRGLAASHRGQWEQAAHCHRMAVSREPADVTILTHATEIFRRAGDHQAALHVARCAVEIDPRLPAAQNNLGLALQAGGQSAAAIAVFRQLTQTWPEYARGHFNLGNLLLSQNHLGEAARCLQTALRLQPNYPQAVCALGQVLHRRHQPIQAVACFRRALRLQPRYAAALLNLGNVLVDLGNWDEAEASIRQALAIEPTHAGASRDLGVLLERSGRLEQALAAYQQAVRLQPESAPFLAALENARRRVCDWDDPADNARQLLGMVRQCLARGEPSPLWPLASLRFPTTAQDQLDIARQHADRIARQIDHRRFPLHFVDRDKPPERLRIGFLGREFSNSVAGHLLQGVFRHFDRRRFEVWLFDYSAPDASDIRRTIVGACDRVVDVRAMSSAAAAGEIARAEVHVLLDINSYMPGGRPEIAAWRPAPVQVSYLYPATTGASWIDYFLTDRQVTPAGAERYFTENLVYLPHCYLPTNADQAIAAACPDRAHWGLPADAFVFCSFNSPDKLEPDVFAAWLRILRAVPNSVLWQRAESAPIQERLGRAAREQGIDAGRLCFAPAVARMEDHLARHRCADLFLDTFIHGAHATAVDALWAGLPLLTCPGQTFASRVGASLLHTAGLPTLIAADRPDYERRAIHLATHPAELQELRAQLARTRTASPVFDTPRLVRNLERAFEAMWQRYAAGQPAEPIEVHEATP